MAMSHPICAGVMCHSRTSTGRTNASDSASKASKNVALPTMMRARRCQREKGTPSRRAINSEELTKLRRNAIRTLDRRQMARPRKDAERRLRNRLVELPRHGDRRRVIVLADDNRDRHRERAELPARVGRAEQLAARRIAIRIVGDED